MKDPGFLIPKKDHPNAYIDVVKDDIKKIGKAPQIIVTYIDRRQK